MFDYYYQNSSKLVDTICSYTQISTLALLILAHTVYIVGLPANNE